MPLTFKCQSCPKKFKVSTKLIGKKIRCKDCNGVMRVPDPYANQAASNVASAPAPAVAPPPQFAAPAPVMDLNPSDIVSIEAETEWIVDCDDCGRQHKPDRSLIGKRVKCKCGAILHLTENTNAQLAMAPLEALPAATEDPFGFPPLPTDDYAAPAAVVQQAPPPRFGSNTAAAGTSKGNSRAARRAREDAMLARVDTQDSVAKRTFFNDDDDDDEEWGPIGTMLGGVAMLIGGGVWSYIAWQDGYVYPYSFILMLFGVLAIGGGLVKLVID